MQGSKYVLLALLAAGGVAAPLTLSAQERSDFDENGGQFDHVMVLLRDDFAAVQTVDHGIVIALEEEVIALEAAA
jgi:hypothetical protein